MRKRFIVSIAAFVICVASTIIFVALSNISRNESSDEFEPQPLVINTVKSGDDITLTVIRDGENPIFQYEGDLELWKANDGKTYGIIHLDEDVLN